MWTRLYDIKYSWLARKYLFPDLIHCSLCGWYPRNGVYGIHKQCCRVEEKVESFQSTLF